MKRSRSGAVIALVLAGLLTGCGDRFEGDGFSFEPAADWKVVEQGEASAGPFGDTPVEHVVTLDPGSESSALGEVDVYRADSMPIPPGVDKQQTLDVMVAGLGFADQMTGGTTQEPTSASLDGEPAAEVGFSPAAPSGFTPQGRILLTHRDDAVYIISQAGIDSAELAEYAVGFDSVVDSWEWTD